MATWQSSEAIRIFLSPLDELGARSFVVHRLAPQDDGQSLRVLYFSHMIGYLRGKVRSFSSKQLVIDVGGVGYLVFPSAEISKKQIKIDNEIEVYVHTHVREDQISLFGFGSQEELDLFKLLITVSGVGPKTALAVLSVGSANEIKNAVAMADVDFFNKVSGIGKKSAQRIIVDLKSKIGSIEELDLSGENGLVNQEVIEALRGMGLMPKEAKEAVKTIDPKLPLGERIRLALRQLK